MTIAPNLGYRPEIDGLRAVAVTAVVLYHAGFAGFHGGYVGVDVFFVISGYLITSIILVDLKSDSFSFAAFYERRARRILPALLFVTLCCLPPAWLLMSKPQMADFARGLLSTLLFVSNIDLWLRPDGYFSPSQEENPLLHMWSLSIEEQFYLVVPALMLLAWRLRGRAAIIGVLATILIFSFAISELSSTRYRNANFYLIHSRAWELALGALLAFAPRPKRTIISDMLVLTGLAAITASVVMLDISSAFPGKLALPAVLGTASIIVFGSRAGPGGILLSNSTAVGIGLISYSAYLWHQPLFAFARIYSLDAPSNFIMAGLSALALLLGYMTWTLIERPFRNRSKTSVRSLAAACATISAVIVSFSIASPATPVVSNQVSASLQLHDAWSDCTDFSEGHKTEGRWFCELSNIKERPSFFVFGDSHATAMFPAFKRLASETARQGLFTAFSGCAPLLGPHSIRNDQKERNCHDMNERIIKFVTSEGISDVFLVARWTYYTVGNYAGEQLSYLATTPNENPTVEGSRAAFAAGVRSTFQRYTAAGIRLHLVLQAPQQVYEATKIYRNAGLSLSSLSDYLFAASVSVDQNRSHQSIYRAAMQPFGSVNLVDLDPIFCRQGRCLVGTADNSFYIDDDHLSRQGAELTFDYLLKAMQDGDRPSPEASK